MLNDFAISSVVCYDGPTTFCYHSHGSDDVDYGWNDGDLLNATYYDVPFLNLVTD